MVVKTSRPLCHYVSCDIPKAVKGYDSQMDPIKIELWEEERRDKYLCLVSTCFSLGGVRSEHT